MQKSGAKGLKVVVSCGLLTNVLIFMYKIAQPFTSKTAALQSQWSSTNWHRKCLWHRPHFWLSANIFLLLVIIFKLSIRTVIVCIYNYYYERHTNRWFHSLYRINQMTFVWSNICRHRCFRSSVKVLHRHCNLRVIVVILLPIANSPYIENTIK